MPVGIVYKLAGKSELLKDLEITLYQQIVGLAIHLSNNTRPDICYPVGQHARFMSETGRIHLEMAQYLLRYFNGTRDVGMQQRSQNHTMLGVMQPGELSFLQSIVSGNACEAIWGS
jgi:hypothetical protein